MGGLGVVGWRGFGAGCGSGWAVFRRWIGFTGPLSAMLRLPVLTFMVIFEAILMKG